MSSPGAGHQFPSQEVAWLKRDVLLFANSIGCTADELHFLYVSPHQRLKASSNARPGTPPRLRCVPYLPRHSPYVMHLTRAKLEN